MKKVEIKKVKTDTGGDGLKITLNHFSKGELFAIVKALRLHNSVVGNDVVAYIRNALYDLKDENLNDLFRSCL